MKIKQQTPIVKFIKETMAIIKDCEGSGLVRELDEHLAIWEEFFGGTPFPQLIAEWIENLIDLMNNCEGAELEQELKAIRLPAL